MRVAKRHCVSAGLVAAISVATSIFAISAATAATIYTVDNTTASCSDSGPGSASQPFCTIEHAAHVALPGDTIVVRAGTYSGTSVNTANSGSRSRPITFTAYRRVRVIGGKNAFALANKSNIVIHGFTITGTSSYGISVTGGANIVISHNDVSSSGLPELGLAAAGIYLKDLSGGLVLDNTSHNNSSHGIDLTGSTTKVMVKGNRSYRNAYQYIRNATGIDVQAPGNTILDNFTYSNEDSGINVYPGATNTIVAQNVAYDNGDHGIDNFDAPGADITGNTVFYNCTSGINVEGTSSHAVIENNISVDNATGAIINPTPINPPGAYVNRCNRREGNIGVYDAAAATAKANFNLVWQANRRVPEYVWAGVVYNTQSRLHKRTGQDARGIFGNPRFRNAAKWNLQLTGNSPAIDSANSDARGEQRTDILGRRRVDDPFVRNTGVGIRPYYDRGAFEYQPPR